ncbi:hypothetical protein RN001_003964 [Aquatica leii]|uniref:Uncharacterized protein n=1 Tax=Aquatica leii TaxID=1421715 RepID=A0AAN7PJB4_9COLE|nr:hypothetical protein RN001_003964 [Aquatica leii]
MVLTNIVAIKNNLFKYKKTRSELATFVKQSMPVFWVIGPIGCGKSTLAEMIAKSSKFHLIDVKLLIKEDTLKVKWNRTAKNYKKDQVSSEIMLNMLKKEIIRTSQNAIGYIIDGFPTNIHEAKLFEDRICNVNVIIYLTLVLDGLLARKVTQIGTYHVNEERIQYIKSMNNLNKLSKLYNKKTIKLHANYPPEATCAKLVEILEDFWGYKFLRLYNKHLPD